MQIKSKHNKNMCDELKSQIRDNTVMRIKSFLVAIVIAAALTLNFIGSARSESQATAENLNSKPIIVAASAADARAGSSGKISLDFVASDIHDVLKALAMQGGINIVAGPDVKGNITISLASVTVDEALKLVAGLSNYEITVLEGVYIIGTRDNIRAVTPSEQLEVIENISESMAIRYSGMDNIKSLLAKQFPSVQVITETVSSKTSTSASQQGETSSKSATELSVQTEPVLLVMFGPKNDVLMAKDMVLSIEKSMNLIANETEVDMVEIKYADIFDVIQIVKQAVPGIQVVIGPNQGFNLMRPDPTEPGTTGAASTDNESSSSTSENQSGSESEKKALPKMLILKGSRTIIDKAKDFIAKIDTRTPQIMIEAKVLDISNDASKNIGIDWSWDSFNVGETDSYAYDIDENGNKTASSLNIPTFGIFHRSPVELIATVNAIVKDGKGRILANPNVIALDGKPASIVIGDKLYYVKSVLQGTNGPSIETDQVQVGIQLHTISSIASDGYITMSIHPEVSVITKMLESNGGFLPQIANRYIDSTVRIKDGETIVLGGLIKDEEIESMSGIPLLRDLPLIGQLFSSKSKNRSHSEIVMFITPKILSK